MSPESQVERSSFSGPAGGAFAIEADNLGVVLGGSAVLRGVSLALNEGDVLGVLGPSGCGKTTMLRALAGLVPLASGSVTIRGRDQLSVPTWHRDIGFVFQNLNALFPHLTVAGNVEFPFRRGGKRLPDVDWRVAVDEILGITGLRDIATRSLATLSGGQLQRVALARALVFRPSILLLDEPLSSLDNELKDSLLALLVDLKHRYGGTYIYVSHDEREIRYLADRAAILLDGEIAQEGPIADVWARPASPRVAHVIGGWNLLTVERDRTGFLTGSEIGSNVGHELIIGIPTNCTSFLTEGAEVPADCATIDVTVDRVATTPTGRELHCRTRNGSRAIALGGRSSSLDPVRGLIAFERRAVHVFHNSKS